MKLIASAILAVLVAAPVQDQEVQLVGILDDVLMTDAASAGYPLKAPESYNLFPLPQFTLCGNPSPVFERNRYYSVLGRREGALVHPRRLRPLTPDEFLARLPNAAREGLTRQIRDAAKEIDGRLDQAAKAKESGRPLQGMVVDGAWAHLNLLVQFPLADGAGALERAYRGLVDWRRGLEDRALDASLRMKDPKPWLLAVVELGKNPGIVAGAHLLLGDRAKALELWKDQKELPTLDDLELVLISLKNGNADAIHRLREMTGASRSAEEWLHWWDEHRGDLAVGDSRLASRYPSAVGSCRVRIERPGFHWNRMPTGNGPPSNGPVSAFVTLVIYNGGTEPMNVPASIQGSAERIWSAKLSMAALPNIPASLRSCMNCGRVDQIAPGTHAKITYTAPLEEAVKKRVKVGSTYPGSLTLNGVKLEAAWACERLE